MCTVLVVSEKNVVASTVFFGVYQSMARSGASWPSFSRHFLGIFQGRERPHVHPPFFLSYPIASQVMYEVLRVVVDGSNLGLRFRLLFFFFRAFFDELLFGIYFLGL